MTLRKRIGSCGKWAFCTVFLAMSISETISADEATVVLLDSVVLSPMQIAEVPAQATGLLREIAIDEGDVVVAGAELAVLDAREAAVALAQSQLELEEATLRASNRVQVEYAEKSLEVARAELARSSDSISQFAKSVSQSQLDVEKLTVEKLRLEKQQAEHELELFQFQTKARQQDVEAAELLLEKHHVRAPFAGTVALVRGRMGEWVEEGAPVVRLVAVDTLRAEGFLDARHLGNVMKGDKVVFRLSSDGVSTAVDGTLKFISPELDPVTQQVRVWAEIPNADGQLRPGQQGELEITR